MASVVLTTMGLWISLFFIYAPEPSMVEDKRVEDSTSLLRHMAAAVAFPFAIVALYWGLRYGRHRRDHHGSTHGRR